MVFAKGVHLNPFAAYEYSSTFAEVIDEFELQQFLPP
jgi:hypothetical protein